MGELDSIILEQTNNLVLIMDQSANVTYVSPSVKKILGFEAKDLLGNNWYIKTRDSYDLGLVAKTVVQSKLISKSTNPFENSINDAFCKKRDFLWSTSPGPDNTVVGIGVDVSEKNRVEQSIRRKNEDIMQQQADLESSIRYAQRLQNVFLPELDLLKEHFMDAFVFNQAKDIVSGDFYFYHCEQGKVFIALADCTGHGVPGAFISMLGNVFLRDIIIKQKIFNPAKVLHQLDKELTFALKKPGTNDNLLDGMDIAFLTYDIKSGKCKVASANRPVLLIKNGEFEELKPNRFGVGFDGKSKKVFSVNQFNANESDLLYFFTDGFTDQFGGEDGKKFNRPKFRSLIQSISGLPMYQQVQVLETTFNSWKGDLEQTDDVSVVGLQFKTLQEDFDFY